MRSVEILRRYDVVLCDIDGVLHNGFDLVDGVPAWLATLRAQGPPIYFLTNNGSVLPEQLASWLEQIGLAVAPANLVTAGEVLVDAFQEHGLTGKPVLNIGNEAAAEYVRRAGGTCLPANEARRRWGEAAAVVIGSTQHLDKEVVDAACNAVRAAPLPVLCTNPDAFAPVRNGEITMVAGAIANLLERELGIAVVRLGKPYRPIFDLALRRIRAALATPSPRVLVIDDNLESGIRGGSDMGFDTLLVLSGWHRSQAEAERVMQRTGVRPTWILDSVVS
jgi:HAD superfamily hydrolase (TIGR01450 family)